MFPSESNTTRSPILILPESGVVSPAMQSSKVVLPVPDAPKRMVMPGEKVKSVSSVKAGNVLRI